MSNTCFRREEKRKVAFRLGENETKVDFVLIKKQNRWFIQNVEGNPWGISTFINGSGYR